MGFRSAPQEKTVSQEKSCAKIATEHGLATGSVQLRMVGPLWGERVMCAFLGALTPSADRVLRPARRGGFNGEQAERIPFHGGNNLIQHMVFIHFVPSVFWEFGFLLP